LPVNISSKKQVISFIVDERAVPVDADDNFFSNYSAKKSKAGEKNA